MTTNSTLLKVGNLEAAITSKSIKNIHLSVVPPNGDVRLSVPHDTKDDVIRVFLASKISWIRRQQQKYQTQLRQTKREYVSGETHYYLGKGYQLYVKKNSNKESFVFDGKQFYLYITNKTSDQKKEQLVNSWYRSELKKLLSKLIKKRQPKISVTPKHWRIQRMKTRWGSCNHETGRILLNLELIKKPYNCIEYIVIHEWLHLIEPKHNDTYIALLDKYLPTWKVLKDELNRFILTYEDWG